MANIWHYWLVFENWASNRPLCGWGNISTTESTNITIVKADVTCQQCIEYLHA